MTSPCAPCTHRGYLCLFRPPGPAQARVRCPAGRSLCGCPSRLVSVALSWHAPWPGAVARRGSRRVCSARSRLPGARWRTACSQIPPGSSWAGFRCRPGQLGRAGRRQIRVFGSGRTGGLYGLACRTLPGRTSEWGRCESAPVTEGAVLHNGAGGRAFAAIWALRLVGCRAAGRASR